MQRKIFFSVYSPLFSFIKAAINSLLLLSLALPGTGAQAQDSALQFTHTERSMQVGEVIRFEIRSALPLDRLQISAFGREFPAFTENEGLKWICLVGIDRDTEPGRYDIRLEGDRRNGKNVSEQYTLVVQSREFPTRTLTVEPKYVTPPEDVQERIREERKLVDSIFEATTLERLWKGPFEAPVPGQVTSPFGYRSVYNGQQRSSHSGTDFRGAVGTLIHAPNSGRIVLTDDLYYTGKTVIIDHGQGLYSYLGHMSAISVKVGDYVDTGDPVGKVGATGRATGPHLHWTVRLRISRVDPISLISVLKEH